MATYENRRLPLDARKWLSMDDLSAEDLQNITLCESIRQRIDNHWPIIKADDFTKWINYKGNYLPFEDVKLFLDTIKGES